MAARVSCRGEIKAPAGKRACYVVMSFALDTHSFPSQTRCPTLIHQAATNQTSGPKRRYKCLGRMKPPLFVRIIRTSRPRALSNSDFSTSSLRMLSDTELLRTADIPDGAKAVADAARARNRAADSIFILAYIIRLVGGLRSNE